MNILYLVYLIHKNKPISELYMCCGANFVTFRQSQTNVFILFPVLMLNQAVVLESVATQ